MRTCAGVAALLLTGCAGTAGGGNGMTAIYSPPVRLGGTGSMIFLPGTVRKIPPPLETPDAKPAPPTATWLVGTWIPDADAEDLDRKSCNSGIPTTYKADGTFWFFDADGRWTLKGDRLTEVLTKAYEQADEDVRRSVGKRQTQVIRRVGRDEALVVYRDGSSSAMLRCRPGDIHAGEQPR